MYIEADLHSHTLACSHAFSTLNEMVDAARKQGLKALAITDHAVSMPDSPHEWYFNNLKSLPNLLDDGFILLKGIEVNVMDPDGQVDMEQQLLAELDWVVASLHSKCIRPLNEEEATRLWLNVAKNPYIDMIGHSEEGRWKYNYEQVVPVFKENNKVVELNASSPRVRTGNEENLKDLMVCCKKYGCKVAVNSDAHSTYNLGNHGWALALLEELEFPPALVVNHTLPQLQAELVLHGRSVAEWIAKSTKGEGGNPNGGD